MKTKTIGEIIRDQRLKHQVDLPELSRKTRIRLEYLKALENNQFDQLPAATFVKGYIKIYARIFGFDHKPLIALLRRDYKESAKGMLIPRDFINPVLKRKKVNKPVTWIVLSLVAVFITLFSYIAWQWYSYNQPPRLVIQQPEEDQIVSSQVEIQGETVMDVILTINSQPVAVRSDGKFQHTIHLPREGINTISIKATDRKGKTAELQRSVYVQY